MAPWAQDPSERPVRFVVPPLGLHGCGCLEGGVANTHGDHALALRGVILVAPSLSRSPNAFTNQQLLFVKHWCNQQRVRCGLDGGFAAACAKMLACRPRLHGVNNSKQGVVDTPV
jgi:hypothetical protein